MKQKLLLIAFTLISIMLRSQSGTPSVPMAFKFWETNLGTQHLYQKNVVKTDGSGNVYTGGASLNVNGKYDGFLTKVTSGGTVIYTVQINGTANDHDFIAGLFVSGTDIFVTGTITNSVTMLPELFIAKYNSSGTQQFFTTYSGGYGDLGKDIAVNSTYNYIIVTGASYNSNFDSDMSVIAFDASGNQQWVNFYNHANLNDGGYKITTRTSMCTITGPVTISPNNYKLASVSYSVATGWQSGSVVTGATATSSVEIVSDLVTDASGNMYLCGATQQNAGQGYDMYVAKVTTSLTIVWEQTINGFSGSSLDDFARGIQVDGSSNVYVTGVTTHSAQGKNLTTVKLNSSGVVQWTKNINGVFNGNDGANDLAIDASSNVYITGYKTISTGNTDIYTAKLNGSTGNIIWETNEESDLNDDGTNLVLDNNDVVVAGSREVTVGNYEYVTYKYVQTDVITPTDFSAETPKSNFMLYPNKGQLLKSNDSLATDIKFYTHQTYPSFFFKDKSQSYVFSRIDTLVSINDTLHRIDLTFNSVNESAKTFSTEEQKTGFLNYYLKHTSNKGIKHVKGNYRLTTTNLYNNIDLMTTSNQNGIKYYFIVKPGGDMRDIKMEFTGATSFSLNGTTNALSINSSIGSLTFDKPIAYQLTAANATVAVTSFSPTWATNGASNKYKFNDGAYTSSLTLIIEVVQKPISTAAASTPPEWGTFYGGSVGSATSHDIVTDANGNLYSTGFMSTASFPITTGLAYQGGGGDAFMTRFNDNYSRIFTTLYGGTGLDKGFGITCDKLNGKIYICGGTDDTSGVVMKLSGSTNSYTNNAFGSNKCFIARYDTASGAIEWATKFGSSSTSYGKRIKADANGNIYVIGDVYLGMTTTVTCASNNSGAFPRCNPGGGAFHQGGFNSNVANPNSFFFTDGYIARFNSQTELTASTLFGGEGDDLMHGITVDDVNNKLYVVGYTKSLNTGPNCTAASSKFPLCNSAGGNYYQDRLNQNNTDAKPDGFISRFSLTTLALEWSTFFGGSDEDVVTDAVTDPSGNLYVTGYTKSLTNSNNACGIPSNGGFPTCPINAPGGGYDAFVTKFKLPGELVWSYYVGGTGNEVLVSGNTTNPRIAINTVNNNIYISGNTRSCTTFPAYNGIAGSYIQTNHGDSICAITPTNTPTDAYVSVYSSAGVLQNSTYFGGRGSTSSIYGPIGEAAAGLATYQHRVYISGSTYASSRFPFHQPATSNPYYNTTYGAVGSNHVFYAQLNSTAVGIHELDNPKTNFGSLTVFPNPTTGKINFEWDNTTSKKAEISVYNLMGQMLGSSVITETKGLNKQEINLSDLTFGLYLVVIKTEIQTLNAKFIKE
jgi:hypothetical protein